MIRHSIRLTSFLFALFAFLLVFYYSTIKQQQFPFNTSDRFELNISNPNITKEEVISELNDITKENQGILVKVVTDSKNYENEKNIIWFGDEPPISDDIVIENNQICWLDIELTGNLISSKDMDNRPIYGMYSVKGTEKFKNEITEWANRNGIAISWYKQYGIAKIIYGYLIQSGIGNAIVTAFLLFVTTLIAWFVVYAKARSIRLLGGLSDKRIHIEDTFSIMLNVAIGFIIALMTAIGYVGFFNSFNQIPLILSRFCIILILLFVLSGTLVYVISKIVRPKSEHLANRRIPLKRFSLLGMGTRALSLVLALLIVPSTLTSANILQQLSREYALWETMQNNVRISFNYVDPLVTEDMLPNVENFCYDMVQKGNMSLSYAVDEAILLSPEEYGNYDHIIVTDKAWIDSYGIGIGNEGNGGELIEISFNTLAEPLQFFLNAHMPLWTKEKTVQPEGIGYYEFSGEEFLALPPNVAQGGSTIQAKNPLVILVENPISTLNMKSFIVPALSSGNIIFSNEEALRVAIFNSPIQEYIVSIDTITDTALEQAQAFRKEAIYYAMACALILISMVFAGIMEAQLWSGANNKLIFTLHTFGRSYSDIMQSPFKKELLVVILTTFIGSILSYVVKHPDPFTIFYVAIIVIFLYGISNFTAYQVCIRNTFYKMSCRNE